MVGFGSVDLFGPISAIFCGVWSGLQKPEWLQRDLSGRNMALLQPGSTYININTSSSGSKLYIT